MKQLLLIMISTFCIGLTSYSQRKISEEDDNIKGKVLFLQYENGKLSFFDSTNKMEEHESLESIHTLSLQDTYSNVYIKWLNPLKYKITWTDEEFEDERDAIIKNFIANMSTQFGQDFIGAKTSAVDGNTIDINLDNYKQSPVKTVQLESIKSGDKSFQTTFYDLALVNLYYKILNLEKSDINFNDKDSLELSEFNHLELLLNELHKLDSLNNISVSNQMTSEFVTMLKASNLEMAEAVLKNKQYNIGSWEEHFKNKESSIVLLTGYFELFKVWDDQRMAHYIQSVISSYLSKVQKETEAEKGLLNDIIECYQILENSTISKSNEPDGYIKLREVNFKEGKEIQSTVSITEINFDEDYRLDGEQLVYTSIIKFRKHDIIVPSVSAGIFYSNTGNVDFGVSTNGLGGLIVGREEYNENLALTATFLNLNFDVRSRYFSPLVQLGIDPTKERPFMLLGTGFSIPAVHFSITGGVVWRWQKTLDSLSEGDLINSTAELESDIRYALQYRPLGGYIGIQWNF